MSHKIFLEHRPTFIRLLKISQPTLASNAVQWALSDIVDSVHWSYLRLLITGNIEVKSHSIEITRSAWQSPTWGRPAPQVRVDCRFRYSKFLSQQRHLPNDPENRTLEPRGKWTCVNLQCTSTSGVSIFAPISFSFVDQSSPRRLENFGEDIPLAPKLSRLTPWIIRQILIFVANCD